MRINPSILLLLLAGSGFSQTSQVPQRPSMVPGAVLDIPDAELEAAQKANPEDLRIAFKLLQYLGQERRDPNWSTRLPLLTWYIEHHPEAAFLGSPVVYADLPEALRMQLKQAWITQVHQHADNPAVLRNAAMAIAPPVSGPSQIRVGGKIQESNLITQVTPEYPVDAKQARIQGTVKMNVTIDREGKVSNIELLSGHPMLVQAAVSAVQKYRYRPTLLNGQPVSVMTTVDVSFTLSS